MVPITNTGVFSSPNTTYCCPSQQFSSTITNSGVDEGVMVGVIVGVTLDVGVGDGQYELQVDVPHSFPGNNCKIV